MYSHVRMECSQGWIIHAIVSHGMIGRRWFTCADVERFSLGGAAHDPPRLVPHGVLCGEHGTPAAGRTDGAGGCGVVMGLDGGKDGFSTARLRPGCSRPALIGGLWHF
jgi:hypothetical protein